MKDWMVFRDGNFRIEQEPEWHKAAVADEAVDSDETLLIKAGCQHYIRENIGYASVRVWKTPDDGFLVGFVKKKVVIEYTFIPNRIDWLPFYVAYIVPFIREQADIQLSFHMAQIGTILHDIRNRQAMG